MVNKVEVNLADQIEELRQEMYHAYQQNLTDEVLKISQELDDVLNQWSKSA